MTFTQTISQNWQIITSLVAVVAMGWRLSIRVTKNYTLQDARISAVEKSNTQMETQITAVYPILTGIQSDMSSVKTSIDWIRGALSHPLPPQNVTNIGK